MTRLLLTVVAVVALTTAWPLLGDDEKCACPLETLANPFAISPPNTPMAIFSNPTATGDYSGKACVASCDSNVTVAAGWGVSMQLVSNNLKKGFVIIYEGGIARKTIDSTVSAAEHLYLSYSDSIEITYDPQGTDGDFMIAMQQDTPAAEPTVLPSTVAPTVEPYDGPMKYNPHLIAHDLYVVLDTATPADKFAKLKELAGRLISELQITTDVTEEVSTRIALVGVTPYPNFITQFSPAWMVTSDTVSGYLGAMTPLGTDTNSKSYFGTLDGDAYLPAAFPTPDNQKANFNASNTRLNAQRTFIIFTNQGPSDHSATQDCKIDFKGMGVHPILVHIDMETTDLGYFNNADNFNGEKFDVFQFGKGVSTDDNLKALIDEHFESADNVALCQSSATASKSNINDGKTFHVPLKYAGVTEDTSTWPENSFTHYCNFQSTSHSVVSGTEEKADMCFTVYYELETNKDFVDVTADGKLIERFTGVDVSGATFKVKAKEVVFTLTTDEKNVYDGFHVVSNKC